MNTNSRILIIGEETLAGKTLLRNLIEHRYNNIIRFDTKPNWYISQDVSQVFNEYTPEYVFILAGKSGGIGLNVKEPATLILDNLIIAVNVIDPAYKAGVKKLLYLASSCCYPRDCPQPMKPDHLLTGQLEPTNEAYAIAKLAGIKLCEAYRKQYNCNFITAIPSTPFGPHDHFNLDDSHIIDSLLARMHQAKVRGKEKVVIWGTGNPRRDFIYSEDLADACIFLMQHYDKPEPINIGLDFDMSVREVAEMIKSVTEFKGNLVFDDSKPDGMPLKRLDVSQLYKLGWKASWNFKEALEVTYTSYIERTNYIN